MSSFLPSSGAALAALGLLFFGATDSASAQQITFTKDIAPILQRSCQNCHRPGNIGPMSLLTYQEARPWARAIKQQVVQRNMPPWYIDRAVGIHSFKNDPSLTDAEIATISKWADSGAPEGNAANLPAPRKFDDSDRWHIGKPDIIVTLKKDVLVKAKAPDQWLDLPTEDLGVKINRYIQAVEVKPIKGVAVVHHAVATMQFEDEQGNEQQSLLEEYAVGKFGDIYAENTGRVLPAGAKVTMNMHPHVSELTRRPTSQWVSSCIRKATRPSTSRSRSTSATTKISIFRPIRKMFESMATALCCGPLALPLSSRTCTIAGKRNAWS